jgi:hypothetical protein
MTDDSKLVYICKSSNDLSFFTDRGSFGGPVETIQRRFFGKDEVSLRKYSFQRVPGDDAGHQNSILVPSGDFIDVLVYDLFDEMDIGWRGHRIPRNERHAVVHAYLEGMMLVTHSGCHAKPQTFDLHSEGPKVIIVDESKTHTKRQPSVKQYCAIVKIHGGIPKVLYEDTSQAVSFDLGLPDFKPAPRRHPEDDNQYA